MKIRKLDVYDHGMILDLDALVFAAAPPDVGEHTAWWVVFDEDGAPVAYAGAMLWEPDDAVYLHRAGVLPRARGLGLQRRMIRVRERWGRANNARAAYTYTAATNTVSANNLIRCGYRLWTPSHWGGSRNPTRADADGIAWLYWLRTLE